MKTFFKRRAISVVRAIGLAVIIAACLMLALILAPLGFLFVLLISPFDPETIDSMWRDIFG